MIRLFRKIRQQLLSEDKYSVYLLYASGEIILVVAGILLALQIDNWNDNRKTREIEKKLLSELVISLNSDMEVFEINIGLHTGGSRASGFLQETMAGDKPYHDSLATYFAMTHNYTVFNPNYGAYESLKSLGVELIRSDEIRQRMIKLYEQQYKNLQQNTVLFTDQIMDLKMRFNETRFEEFNLFNLNRLDTRNGTYGGRMVPVNFEALKNDKSYRYHLRTLKRGHKFLIDYNVMIRDQVSSLISLLEEEIQ